MEGSGELQCVGRMEVARPKQPVGFLCGTLPVSTDAVFTTSLHSAALLPSAQAIGAPRYQMLPAETDLNTLPLLSNMPEKVFPGAAKASEDLHREGVLVDQNLSKKCEALAVSGLTEYGDEIDVVAPSDILKQIFKMPYSKAQLSIAVHRIGDTLILNTGPDIEEGEKMLRRHSNQSKGSDPILLNFAMHSVRAEACDCPPGHQPAVEKQSSSTMLPGNFGHREKSFVSSANSDVSESQFLNKSSSSSRKSTQGNRDNLFWHPEQSKQKGKMPGSVKKSSQVGEKARCPVQESDKYKRVGNNGFLRVLFWQFHNFRMLLGSDLLLFSNEKYVAVSLHLWDVARQVTPLTWLEAWLDNVMASVPELAICYHENGVVQGYELLKTDDIFLLKGISEDGNPAFHPQVVQQNGLSVLRFLQDNCKQDPGAYWLYKSAGEDVIQLFDLSVIPKSHSTDDHDKECSALTSLVHKGRRDSLFSLGTLLYRVAHRFSLSKAPGSRSKCAKFFKKCLDFLREHDHLVVRAYAHEQFARLILKCNEELELTSDSFLLGSEVTVTDLEEESSEISQGMFGSLVQDIGPSEATDGETSNSNVTIHNAGAVDSGTLKLEGDSCTGQIGSSTETEHQGNVTSFETHDSLDMCQVASATPHFVQTIADPISSKLAAIHHVSQAIKSLRWNRQLQNTRGDLIDNGHTMYERCANFSVCACGDVDCIEVCDIREWLPKSKIDRKMWKLILLLGESYLALGEAYKEDGQLYRALKVVELASLVYGSMPQHLEDAWFISSMNSSSPVELKYRKGNDETDLVADCVAPDSSFFVEDDCTDEFSPTYLFWSKAWMLVGDVYAAYYRTRGTERFKQSEREAPGSGLRMSNEVVKEVKHLKKKLGQAKPNCTTCSLVNCSCQSDRASSGNSASSSSGEAPSSYGRKQNRRSHSRNLPHSRLDCTQDCFIPCKVPENVSKAEAVNQCDDMDIQTAPMESHKIREHAASVDVAGNGDTMELHKQGSRESNNEDEPKARHGGIFKFLEGPKYGDPEYNMSAAVGCYDAARKAMDGFSFGSSELQSVIRKKGWVCNELGRYRLEIKKLSSAEIAFADAIVAFKEVSDHTNTILINCNLGHGRRAMAEELVSKMTALKDHELLQNAYKQALKAAKFEYFESLRFYGAAKAELNLIVDGTDPSLRNEVCTQYAHTYLRLGMLLASEGLVAEHLESGRIDELSGNGKAKESKKHEMSASEAFREALSTYEFLGELRKQEAAYTSFQLACYQRDSCLKYVDLEQKQVRLPKGDNCYRQKAKWYASLAEKNWQKSMDFYGPKTHSAMYLSILLEQSALSLCLSSSFHSPAMLDAAILHLLKARNVVEENEGCSLVKDPEIESKFWNQLQALLKTMLTASLAGGPKPSAAGQAVACTRAGDAVKLKEMYRMSLRSTRFEQLHEMHKLWLS